MEHLNEQPDVVVVGAGQGGLGAAQVLGDQGLDVVVLERGQIGETWLSQRWESFSLNTPNWMNGLPGSPYRGDDPDGFMTHTELVDYFRSYVAEFGIDVRTNTTVTRITRDEVTERFDVEGQSETGPVHLSCSYLVVGSGIANLPRLPAVAKRFPSDVVQLSTGSYRSPASLPEGAVLVVGGGQSGGQVAEDLLDAGRNVYFSISNVGRLPRRYRGRDFMYWMLELGIWDINTADADVDQIGATNPLTSGVGQLGRTISFQQLAAKGARLMGRLEDVQDGVAVADDRTVDYIRFSDEFSQEFKDNVDRYLAETGADAEPPELDPADQPAEEGSIEFLNRLDLGEAAVGTVIWCTGFGADFSWIDLPVCDEHGRPTHQRGVSPVEGLFFIGFPWLSKRKSGVIYGIEEDALHIASTIEALASTE